MAFHFHKCQCLVWWWLRWWVSWFPIWFEARKRNSFRVTQQRQRQHLLADKNDLSFSCNPWDKVRECILFQSTPSIAFEGSNLLMFGPENQINWIKFLPACATSKLDSLSLSLATFRCCLGCCNCFCFPASLLDTRNTQFSYCWPQVDLFKSCAPGRSSPRQSNKFQMLVIYICVCACVFLWEIKHNNRQSKVESITRTREPTTRASIGRHQEPSHLSVGHFLSQIKPDLPVNNNNNNIHSSITQSCQHLESQQRQTTLLDPRQPE